MILGRRRFYPGPAASGIVTPALVGTPTWTRSVSGSTGNVTVAMPTGTTEGQTLLLYQTRVASGAGLGTEYAGATTLIATEGNPIGGSGSKKSNTRISTIAATSGMISSGIVLNVGPYALAGVLAFDVPTIFVPIHATPNNSTNWVVGAADGQTTRAFLTQTGAEGDLALQFAVCYDVATASGTITPWSWIQTDTTGGTAQTQVAIASEVLAAAGSTDAATTTWSAASQLQSIPILARAA